MIGRVLSELKGGRKYGHWIWFIFPQLKGGNSLIPESQISDSSFSPTGRKRVVIAFRSTFMPLPAELPAVPERVPEWNQDRS